MALFDGSVLVNLLISILKKLIPNIADEAGVRKAYQFVCDKILPIVATKTNTLIDDNVVAWLAVQGTNDEAWAAAWKVLQSVLPQDPDIVLFSKVISEDPEVTLAIESYVP